MTTVSSRVRIAAAASAIAAAGLVAPATVANATPAMVPAPMAALDIDCTNPVECTLAEINDSPTRNSVFWIGKANPNFQPIVGFVFPNPFGLNFEACFLGGAVHLSPYGGGFVGIGRGC